MAVALQSLRVYEAQFLQITSAEEMACLYNDYVSGIWRGESGWSAFQGWLADYWRPEVMRPPGPPTAVCIHGGGGRGLSWYEGRDIVLGFVSGANGGYRVPVGAMLPGRFTIH